MSGRHLDDFSVKIGPWKSKLKALLLTNQALHDVDEWNVYNFELT